jgi:prophage regulatory protein
MPDYNDSRITRRPGAMVGFVIARVKPKFISIVAAIGIHAGGPGYKGTAAAVSADVTVASTGTDGSVVAVAGDDDDDDGGDGDPDSDRALPTSRKPRYTKSLQIALDRKRGAVSNRIVRMSELKVRIGLSRSTIYEFQKSGNFPRSVSLGARAVGWLESDIDAWVESRINNIPEAT